MTIEQFLYRHLTSVRYKEISTKNTKDTKKRSDHTGFKHCHFTKNANIQSLFRAFRAFRGQKLLMSNLGKYHTIAFINAAQCVKCHKYSGKKHNKWLALLFV